MKYYHRVVEKELSKMLGNFPVIMILGPRQVGKSTLLDYLSQQHKIKSEYVTLDNAVQAGLADRQPEQFLSSFGRPLVIDEFQYANNLTSYIKIEVDNARRNALFGDGGEVGTIFYLTGSQVFESMDSMRESLAGRVGILNLYGLSAREIEQIPGTVFSPVFADIKARKPSQHLGEKELYKRILRGGYPELYINSELSTQQFFSSYLQTYIERDFRKRLRPENEYDFTRFVSLLAARTGQQLVIDNIASDLGVDGKTISSWVSLLSSTGLIYLLQPYHNQATKRLAKRPKVYFTDTGLACYLAGYPTVDGLMNSAFKGQIFETYVFTELLKSYVNSNADVRGKLFYYRRNDKQESDILINIRDTFYPIEIKSSERVTAGDVNWFHDLEKIGLKVGDGTVICRSSHILPLDERSHAVPVEYI
ncbi:ATP-binding protein [Candidatus Saccharibacteria bacterium]|nr:ATP-binding protein [Candidatus Saccharibacteria bacterium]